jgi:membrane protease YdiL (CAAX protease family)
MNYGAHAHFVAPARESAALWRLVVGFILAVIGYVALNQMFFQAVYSFIGAQSGALYDEILRGSTPQAMYLLLCSFLFMTMAVGVVVRVVHRRPALGLLGDLRTCMAQFWSVSLAMMGLLAALLILPPWDMGGDFVANLPLDQWLYLLPFSLIAVLVQVSAEEIVFRGYVQQQIAARFKSPLIWMVLPSVLFALGHYLPDSAGENALLIAVWAGVFGIMMADLTARAGTLGPAIAVHLWNNVSAILIVSLPNDLSGLALYLAPFGMDDAAAMRDWLPVDFVLMFVSWLAARLALRR